MKDSLKLPAETCPVGVNLSQVQSYRKQSLTRSVFKDTLIYGFSRYLSVFAALFLTPIYTRILTKADYGVMDIYSVWIMLFLAIIPLGMLNGLLRFFPDVETKKEERRSLVSSVFFTILLLTFVFVFIAILAKDHFLNIVVGSSDYNDIFFYAVAIVLLSITQSFNLQLLRLRMKKWHFLTVSLSNFLLLSSLGFILVYFYNTGIKGFFQACLIALLFSNIVGFLFNSKEFTFNMDLTRSLKVMKYSFHFLSVFFLFHITNLIDRFLITEYFSLDHNGIYAIGMKMAGFVNFTIAAFSLAWMPYVFKISTQKDAPTIYSRMFDKYILASTVLIFFIVLFKEELIMIFAPGYEAAFLMIAIMAFYFFVMGLTNVLTIGIQISKKTSLLTYSAIVSIVVNISVSILLLGRMGIDGIALGSLCGAIVWIGIQYYFAQKAYKIPFNFIKNGVIVVLLLLAIALIYSFNISSIEVKILLILCSLILAFFKIFRKWDHILK